MQKTIDKQKTNEEKRVSQNSEYTEKIVMQITQRITMMFVFLESVVFFLFYLYVGEMITLPWFRVLCALQSLTVLLTFYIQSASFERSIVSKDINDYPFYRWNFLFNVILDYIYYPLAIYLLIH